MYQTSKPKNTIKGAHSENNVKREQRMLWKPKKFSCVSLFLHTATTKISYKGIQAVVIRTHVCVCTANETRNRIENCKNDFGDPLLPELNSIRFVDNQQKSKNSAKNLSQSSARTLSHMVPNSRVPLACRSHTTTANPKKSKTKSCALAHTYKYVYAFLLCLQMLHTQLQLSVHSTHRHTHAHQFHFLYSDIVTARNGYRFFSVMIYLPNRNIMREILKCRTFSTIFCENQLIPLLLRGQTDFPHHSSIAEAQFSPFATRNQKPEKLTINLHH